MEYLLYNQLRIGDVLRMYWQWKLRRCGLLDRFVVSFVGSRESLKDFEGIQMSHVFFPDDGI